MRGHHKKRTLNQRNKFYIQWNVLLNIFKLTLLLQYTRLY